MTIIRHCVDESTDREAAPERMNVPKPHRVSHAGGGIGLEQGLEL